MRTLMRTLLVALLLLCGAATASASTITVVWQAGGAEVVPVDPTPGATYTADIVLTIGAGPPPDTAIGGIGAGIELSADYTTGAGTFVGSTQNTLTGWLALGSGPVDNGISHVENVVAEGDFFGTGQTIPAGASVTIGTLTVSANNPGVVTVRTSGPSDDIFASSGNSIVGEFTFIGGTIIPEPASAGLLGLGVLALAALRRRKG